MRLRRLGLLVGLVACSSGARPPAPNVPAQVVLAAGPPERWLPYEAVPLIPRQVIFGHPDKANPLLSPDGALLAYLAPHDGVLNIWARTVGKEDDRVITADKKRGIYQYRWAEDGKNILYLKDADGDENWHVYAVPVAGGDALDLTPIEGVHAQIIGVERKKPGTILVGLNDRNPELHDVYAIDIATANRTIIAHNELGAVAWIADHALRLRGMLIPTPDGAGTLKIFDLDTGNWRDLLTIPAEDVFSSRPLSFAGDDRTLYLLASVGSQTSELRALDARTGKLQVIATDPSCDVTSVSLDGAQKIDAVVYQRDRPEWKGLTPQTEKKLGAARALGEGVFAISSRSRDDRRWLITVDDDNGPMRYYVLDTQTGKTTFLFSNRQGLEELALAERKPVTYQARDGLTIHGYVTLPVGVDPRMLPAVVFPHGGPWDRDTWGFDATALWLANRGYAVLQPNFRGSTGFGKAFLNGGDREWGGKMQDDITDGTKWLVAQGFVDPSRICIMGDSFGGYATLMALAKEPGLYACGIDIVGMANLVTWLKTMPPYRKPFLPILNRRVGDAATEEAFLMSRSPIFLTDRIQAPLLIGQGRNDPSVPYAESIQIKEALENAGKQVLYIEYADEGHGFARPENRLDFFATAEQFLAQHIGGRVEPK
jgi:dipeptidyl aminopeptidase/acylaminoacyl peptidase